MKPLRDVEKLRRHLCAAHAAIRDAVIAACEEQAQEVMAAATAHQAGDTIFAVDRIAEDALLQHFDPLARQWPCLLVAEGLGDDGQMVLPRGTAPADAEIALLIDPIDGTRGLMYQKRPAFILTGVAALEPGRPPALEDIQLAVQTEIPLVKQHLCDTLWAVAGGGAAGERLNRFTGARAPLAPRPSQADTIAYGFGGLSRFFPGGRGLLAEIDDDVVRSVLGPVRRGHAATFEDQYISTAGQLHELMMGHDRWTADLRPLLGPVMRARGGELGLCCHPYDLATELIAREAGVIVTGPDGARLTAPFDVTSEMSWIGYANTRIRQQIEPALTAALRGAGLLPPA